MNKTRVEAREDANTMPRRFLDREWKITTQREIKEHNRTSSSEPELPAGPLSLTRQPKFRNLPFSLLGQEMFLAWHQLVGDFRVLALKTTRVQRGFNLLAPEPHAQGR